MPADPPPAGEFTAGDRRALEEQAQRTDAETNSRAWIQNLGLGIGSFLWEKLWLLLGIPTIGALGKTWLDKQKHRKANDQLSNDVGTLLGMIPVDKREGAKQRIQSNQAKAGVLDTVLGILNGRK